MSPARASEESVTLHATTVAVAGGAALIRGASGTGKSGLALQLMALGARLVADDRTVLRRQDDMVVASAPDILRGQIEARFVGLLAAETLPAAPLRLLVDLDTVEMARLPEWQHEEVLGVAIPVIRKSEAPHFPAAIMLYLQGSRIA